MSELCESCYHGHYMSNGHCDYCNMMRETGSDLGTALNALRMLYDTQNGCPLPKYETDWNRAMTKAEYILKKCGN